MLKASFAAALQKTRSAATSPVIVIWMLYLLADLLYRVRYVQIHAKSLHGIDHTVTIRVHVQE